MKPPTCIGDTSLTVSISAGRSKARCKARRTRGSSNGFRLLLTQVAWTTLWLKVAVDRAGIAAAMRAVTGSDAAAVRLAPVDTPAASDVSPRSLISTELSHLGDIVTEAVKAEAITRPSIAVLPFENLSNDPENDYFSYGLTEDIIRLLARNRWLSVISRHSTIGFKGRAVDAREPLL